MMMGREDARGWDWKRKRKLGDVDRLFMFQRSKVGLVHFKFPVGNNFYLNLREAMKQILKN